MRTITIQVASFVALIAAACGTSGPSADDLNNTLTGGSTATGGGAGTDVTGGTGASTGGTGATTATGGSSTGGTVNQGGTGAIATGGAGAMATGGTDVVTGGGGGAGPLGGTGGSDMPPTGGSGGSGMMTGGTGGAGMTGGTGGSVTTGPYDPRTGSFKMLAYSKTSGFRHDSIPAGKTMLQQIATEQGFQVDITEANDQFTAAGLAQYEIVFFMNSTGNNFTATEKQAYETWMTTKNGAFGGVHSATDTENGWAFYSEVTGQYYDLHDACCATANIQWDAAALTFVAVRGLPSPWSRSEEWYKFNRAGEWAAKPGFKILSRVTTTGGGTRPVSYVREWGNFRAFYTSLGHQPATFQDADVKKHVAAGIMWAVRREALLR